MSFSNQQSTSRTYSLGNQSTSLFPFNMDQQKEKQPQNLGNTKTHFSTFLQFLMESGGQIKSIEEQQKNILAYLNNLFGNSYYQNQVEAPGHLQFSNQYLQASNLLKDKLLGLRLDEIERNQEILKRLLRFNNNDVENSTASTNSLNTNKKLTQRQISIQRYKAKQRNWNKRVAYECRKKVAEDRLRVKGRFISKEDQTNIEKLVQTDHKSVFDQKNNLDLKKFQSKIKLFSNINSKRISKKTILEKIRSKVITEQRQAALIKRIEKRQQIFQIEVLQH